MKRKFILLLLVGFLLAGCTADAEERKEHKIDYAEKYGVDIIKVRNCEYVLWFNGYGSDMEHYEGCKNKEHEKL